jgi:hypothetical protein
MRTTTSMSAPHVQQTLAVLLAHHGADLGIETCDDGREGAGAVHLRLLVLSAAVHRLNH